MYAFAENGMLPVLSFGSNQCSFSDFKHSHENMPGLLWIGACPDGVTRVKEGLRKRLELMPSQWFLDRLSTVAGNEYVESALSKLSKTKQTSRTSGISVDIVGLVSLEPGLVRTGPLDPWSLEEKYLLEYYGNPLDCYGVTVCNRAKLQSPVSIMHRSSTRVQLGRVAQLNPVNPLVFPAWDTLSDVDSNALVLELQSDRVMNARDIAHDWGGDCLKHVPMLILPEPIARLMFGGPCAGYTAVVTDIEHKSHVSLEPK